MDYVESLRRLIAEYLTRVEILLKEAKPGDGLLGMGKAPQHDACHEAFDLQVEALLAAAAEQGLSAPEAADIAGLLLFSDAERAAPACAGWMLIAVHRHCMKLLPFLTPEVAADLHARYSKVYPFYRRLPVQKELLRALGRK